MGECMKVFGWICSDMFYERIGKIYVSWKIKYKEEVEQKKKIITIMLM